MKRIDPLLWIRFANYNLPTPWFPRGADLRQLTEEPTVCLHNRPLRGKCEDCDELDAILKTRKTKGEQNEF